MSDLSAEQLTVLRKLGAHPMLQDSVVDHDLIAAMVAEIDRHRAMVKRLEELAISLEHGHHPDQRKIGAELRTRINGA